MELAYVTWGSGEIVVRALRAVAIFAAPGTGYITALLVASLMGLLVLMAGTAFAGSGQQLASPVKMVLAILLATGILLAPVRITVADRFDGGDLLWAGGAARGTVVVADVPLGVALPAAVASSIGAYTTRVLETALAPVDAEDRLGSAGLWLSARALRAMAEDFDIDDPTLALDFRYFVENCTYFDVQAGRVSKANLRTRTPLGELALTAGGLTSLHIGANGAAPVRAVSCPIAWGGGTLADDTAVAGLAARIRTEAAHRKLDACQSLRGVSLALDATALRAAQADAQDPTTGSAATCGDDVFAHAMAVFGFPGTVAEQFRELVAIKLLRDSSHALAAQNPQTLALTQFLAQRQRDATFVVAGELAATALPALRGLLEAILLVLLPLLLVGGLLFFEHLGKFLRNGLVLVLWLQMWPPVMAVVNNVGQWVQIAAVNEHTILSNGRFTLATVDGLLAELDTQLALSRYMLVLVPLLAWALVRAGEFSGAMLAGRLMQPGEQAAGSFASQAATSSFSTDQVNMAPRTSVGPHVGTVGDPWGGSVTRYEQAQTMSMPHNEPGYLAAAQTSTVTQALQRRAEDSFQQLSEHREQYARSVDSAYANVYGTQGREMLGVLREQGVSDQTSMRALEATGETIRQTVANARSVDQQSGSAHSWNASWDADARLSRFMVMPVDVGAGFGSVQTHDARLAENMSRSYDRLDEQSKAALEEVGTALQRSGHTGVSTSYEQVSSDAYQASLRESTTELESVTNAEQSASRLARASEVARTSGQSVIHELVRDPANMDLLVEMHRLHSAQGLPFDQAWKQAQENTGTRLDIDAVASRLLEAPLPPQPTPEQSLTTPAGEHAQNRARVDQQQEPLPATPELEAADQRLQQARDRVDDSTIVPTPEHYDHNRTWDHTVSNIDNEPMIMPERSLSHEADKRLTHTIQELFGMDEQAQMDRDQPADDKATAPARDKSEGE